MNKLNPSVPFIWPEARVLKELLVYADPAPYQSLIESAGSMSGIVYGIDDDGVRWLEDIFKKAALRSKLILVVYPACPTRYSAFKKLLEIQHLLTDRISFRILPSDLESGAPSNILCFISSDDSSKVYFSTGPTPNFGLIKPGPGQANFVFRGDDVLLEAWRNWFNLAWNESAPLNTRTINIPALVPATGTVEAAEMWRTYLEQCRISMIQDSPGEARTEIEIDQETGEVSYKTEDGAKKETPTDELNIQPLDRLAEKVSRIYEKGMQVNFDKFSRIQPLDAPIRAEWFGVESFRRVGAVSRKTEYRISVLDEETLRALENKKKAGRRILTQLSYPLGDDQRWMPEKVRPLFEKELARVNNEGREQLNKALPGGVDNFVKSRREQVINDANLMYQEFHPGEVLSKEVITKILDDLKERLNKAFAGKFIPEVNYNRIGFHIQRGSDWVSNWGQPLLLLQKIAEFPRKSLTDSYFLQGLRLDQRELLEAMDVCDDIIVKESRKSNVFDRAKNELKLLEEIMKSQADNRLKCEAILALMAGEDQDKIKEKLYRQEKVNGVINPDKPANKKQKVIQLKPR